MTSGAGHFDSLGNPCLRFQLCGVAHDPPGLEFEAIIDTWEWIFSGDSKLGLIMRSGRIELVDDEA
jgi:hypothetical protein